MRDDGGIEELRRQNERLRAALAKSQAESDAALRELRDSNRELEEERNIFVNGPVVVFKWRNAEGWPVEYASPNVEDVFGYSAEAFLSGEVPYAAVIHPEDLERVGQEVQQASQGAGDLFGHEPYRVLHRDGSLVWLKDLTTILRDSSKRITHYLGYVIDITPLVDAEQERRRLERQVLHSQKLESLGILAGGIAHDFNNLLTPILGNVGVLRETLELRSAGAEILVDIEAATLRAADLAQQLLAYSGRGHLQVLPLDVNGMLRELANLLKVSISRNVELVLNLTPESLPIEADAAQLSQVFLNLLTNASEAIGERPGQVRLTTAYLNVGLPGADPRVLVRVSDTGEGMSAATLERIFDPFFTTKETGRGLGMAAVQGIVRGHRGTIDVQSAPGEGTLVELSFPATKRPVVAPQPAAPTSDALPRGKILIVDDEAPVRTVTRRILQEKGLSVLVAEDGRAGLEVFREHAEEISLVLLDLTMPNMGGRATFRELRALDPEVPVLLMSGYDEEDVLNRLDEVIPTGYLKKPFRAATLVEAVQRAVQGSRRRIRESSP